MSLDSYAGDSEIHDTVRESIRKVALEGDIGIRRLSEQFDNWSPVSFRLSEEEISEIIESVPERVKQDIRFSQAQVRQFAEYQRTFARRNSSDGGNGSRDRDNRRGRYAGRAGQRLCRGG